MNKKFILSLIVIVVIIGGGFLILKSFTPAPSVTPPNVTVDVKQNVENYLRENIVALSPVKAVLGGTWYVTFVTTDVGKNSGTVTYEDGHIQEIKNFSYATNNKGEVISLTIIDSNNPIACTMEAKLCPDGSYVGRSGPNCEFAACPNTQVKNETTAVLNQRILNGGVYITPLSVVSDSRCPVDVQCIWAGEITIKIKLEKGLVSKEVELKEFGTVLFERNEVSFISVIPENKTKPVTPEKDYKFTFKVTMP